MGTNGSKWSIVTLAVMITLATNAMYTSLNPLLMTGEKKVTECPLGSCKQYSALPANRLAQYLQDMSSQRLKSIRGSFRVDGFDSCRPLYGSGVSVDSTLLDLGSMRVIIGVDNSRPGIYDDLVNVVDGDQGEIVNTVSMGSEVEALVAEVPANTVMALAESVLARGLARYVEPSTKFQAQLVPNDSDWTRQWGLRKVEADFAWNTTLGDSSIIVAVIDTGIDYNHADLASHYVPSGFDWVNDDADPIDDNGHGTHCAGIIGAVLNNEMGIAGVAQVSLMAEKALNSSGWGDDDDLANAIVHAVDHGAKILSNSWGSYSDSLLIHDAIKYASDHGVLVVAAAGNGGSSAVMYPASYDEVIAVTATNQDDGYASFTNHGSWVDLAAPGVSIYSTVLGNSYDYMSGTSMACPHVSGLAALIWSQFPNATRDWVRIQLRYTADDLGDIGFDEYYGYGRINARRAVEQAPQAHDLVIFDFKEPKYIHVGESAFFSATVFNFGTNGEQNILVNLLVNGELIDSAHVEYLLPSSKTAVAFSWFPITEGVYNVTLFVVPVLGEDNSENNVISRTFQAKKVVGNVVFEEAHMPMYSIGNNPASDIAGGYSEFADYLASNGYNVSATDDGAIIDASLLAAADVLVITAPQKQYFSSELDAIKKWVQAGGRLLLIGELASLDLKTKPIASLFNIKPDLDGICESDENVGDPLWPYYNGTNIIPHLVTAGVSRVEMYGSDGIEVAQGQVLIKTDSDGTATWLIDEGWASHVPVMIALEGGSAGLGRLIFITDSNLWDSVYDTDGDGEINFHDSDNDLLALNTINWLSTRTEHDLTITIGAPTHLKPAETSSLTVMVRNKGTSDETNVNIQVLINGTVVKDESATIIADGTYSFDFPWAADGEGIYNVTAVVLPVTGEDVTMNNVCSRFIRVHTKLQILAYTQYTDYWQEYSNTLSAIDSTFGSDYDLTELGNYTDLDSALIGKDVLLVPEQEHSSFSTMQMIGSKWAETLRLFLTSGGVLVICDCNGGSYGILVGAELFSVIRYEVKDTTSSRLYMIRPVDPLSRSVAPSFDAPNGTVSYSTKEGRVVLYDGQDPVVFHKTLSQGHIVLLGFDYNTVCVETEQILGNAIALAAPFEISDNTGQGSNIRCLR